MKGRPWELVISILIVIAVVGLDHYAYLDGIDTTAPGIPSYYADVVELRVATECFRIEVDYLTAKINRQITDVERALRPAQGDKP